MESRDDRVRRVALEAAREATGNPRLTLEDEVDSSTAISIGHALADEFDVEILGESSSELAGPIGSWVDYMNILLDR